MRRTMESIAAERLNKIGKNPSIVCPREDFQSELKAVSELLTAQSPSDDSESDISLFNKSKNKSSAQLPRPKSESCFPLMGGINVNGGDKPVPTTVQRKLSFFKSITGKSDGVPESENASTCITITAPSSNSLNKD